MKTILVTGADGFIGVNLVQKLLLEKNNIHIIVRSKTHIKRVGSFVSQVTVHEVDIENFSELKKIIKQIRPSIIFHLAAYGVISHESSAKVLLSNVLGTYNLLQSLKDIPYESFIHMGGSSEYGNKDVPMNEKSLLEPTTFYGLSKACSTLLVMQHAFEYNKPICILRAFSVYGPYESEKRLIPTVIKAALFDKELLLTDKGYFRDYIFVEDLIDACLLTVKKGLRNEIINIGSGIQTTNEAVVSMVEEILQKKIKVRIGAYPKRLSDKTFWLSDISKAKKILGWEPNNDLRQGLQKTINYYESTLY